jgi:hypothetical protein
MFSNRRNNQIGKNAETICPALQAASQHPLFLIIKVKMNCPLKQFSLSGQFEMTKVKLKLVTDFV